MASQKVLMLGAGFVTRPTLDILSQSGVAVTVGMIFSPLDQLLKIRPLTLL